jgi:hypothetical protein
MTTAPQRTWTLLDARWRPRLVPSLVQQWLGAGAVQTLVGRDIIEGRGDTAGRAPSWCTTYLFDLWMAASPSANALDVADESPPPMLMGDVRSSNGSRHEVRPPRSRSSFRRPEDPSRATRQMFQLPFLLTPSSDLPVATVLSALSRLPSPR